MTRPVTGAGAAGGRLGLTLLVGLALSAPLVLTALDPLGRDEASSPPASASSQAETASLPATPDAAGEEGAFDEPIETRTETPAPVRPVDKARTEPDVSGAVEEFDPGAISDPEESPAVAKQPLKLTEDLWGRWILRPDPGIRFHGSVTGTILDDEGAPVMGEEVWLWGEPHVPALTDAWGRFLIAEDWVHARGRGLMVGSRSGALELTQVRLVPDRVVEVDGVIPRGFPLRVEVVGGSPVAPIEGALVQLYVPTQKVGQNGAYTLKGWTGPDGAVVFPHAVEEYYSLFVLAEGWQNDSGRVNLTSGPRDPVRVDLTAANRLVVRIVGWPEGLSSRARLWLRERDTNVQRLHEGTVEEPGIYVGSAPLPGTYGGWLECESWRLDLPEFAVPEGGGEVVEVVLTRPEGASIQGRLLDEKGQPVVGEVRGRTGPGAARVRPDGSFSLHPVEPGRQNLSVHLPDQRIYSVLLLDVPEEGVEGLEVVLPSASAFGRVVGAPLPLSGSVRLQQFEANRWRGAGTLTLRPDGSFAARYLGPGRFRISVGVLEGGFVADAELTLEQGETRYGLELPWVENPDVEFHVKMEGYHALPAHVFVSPRGSRGFRVALDPEGRGKTSDLPVGRWQLSVIDSSRRGSVEVVIGHGKNEVVEVTLVETRE